MIEEHSGKILVAIGFLSYISQNYQNAPVLNALNILISPAVDPIVQFGNSWWRGLTDPEIAIPDVAAILIIATAVGFPLKFLNEHKHLLLKKSLESYRKIRKWVRRYKTE